MIVPWVAVEVGGLAVATLTATGMVGSTATEATTLITALTAGTLAILGAVVTLIKTIQTGRKVEAVQRDIKEVHVLIDGRTSRLDERVAQLVAVIETSDKVVPPAARVIEPDPKMVARVAQLTTALEGSDTVVPDPLPADHASEG